MFEHILVPLDGSSLAECVLPHALEAARAFAARITLLQVLEPSRNPDDTVNVDPLGWHLKRVESEIYLGTIARRLRDGGGEVDTCCVEGPAADRIIETARRQDVDLIALSSHGRHGLSPWNVSSVVQKIIVRSQVSTYLVRAYRSFSEEPASLRYRRLAVTLDGSARAECVLPLATRLARFHDAELLLAHVVRRPEMPGRVPLADEDAELAERVVRRNEDEARRYLGHLQARLAADVESIRPRLVVHTSAAAALHDVVGEEKADLVVMSAHGHSGGIRWPYGSVTTSFIAYGYTPLLIVQDLSPDEVEQSHAELAVLETKGH